MRRVIFDLGTNIDRETSLAEALERLSHKFSLKRASSVYVSAPVGMANQPDYFNLSLEVETEMSVEQIRQTARDVEDGMGRNRSGPKYGPRIIDIDILLDGNTIDPDSSIPHPQTKTQLFVVLPLAELYPDEKHPELDKTWSELKRSLLAGRSAKDAGIAKQCDLESLPLSDKVKELLLAPSR